MKLQEIICEKSDLSVATPINFKGRTFLPISGDLAGEGVQARVYHTGQGMVTKVASAESMDDPTLKFLKIVLDNQDNPFFPKIYHARLYKDKTGQKEHMLIVVQMEKLTPLQSSKIEDAAIGLFHQLGFELNQSEEYKIAERPPEKQKQARIQYYARYVDMFFDATEEKREKLLKSSKNPQFNEAIRLLYPYVEYGMSDLHAANWMARLTKHGPQLVIIDPFTPDSFRNEYGEDDDWADMEIEGIDKTK